MTTDARLLDEFYTFLENYMEFYKEFLLLESEKYQVVSKNKFRLLDDLIKEEQVFLLKSRGMEKTRDQYLTRFGSKDFTLKTLIDAITAEEYKNKYQNLHKQLSGVLYDLKEANRLCNFLIELNLHKIENRIKRLEHQPQTEKIYSPNPQQASQTLTIISKKV